jgi:ubiquinone/menaquinone biosynthesis C-methylase UbiE
MNYNITARQQHEKEYYNKYVRTVINTPVNFAPVLGKEKRPWNSYWTVYHIATELYKGHGQTLLDLGCGDGRSCLRFAKIGYQVTGCDISEGNVQQCRKLALEYGFQSQISCSLAVAEQLDYKDESFDLVVGIDVLHHVEIAPALLEVRRVLKCGGSAIFRDPVEIPVFDVLRKTRLVTCFFPMGMSFEDQRTADEIKLNKNDLITIRTIFSEYEEHRYLMLARLHKIFHSHHPERPSRLEMIDHFIMQHLPFLHCIGGEIIHVLKK